jgi:hypothetical protein
MQRLRREGLPVEEFSQTQSNLTAIGQGLFQLVQGRSLALYPDAAMRLAVSRAVAVETTRGWRISKASASHRIDVVVALGMACFAAVSNGGQQGGGWFFASLNGGSGVYGAEGLIIDGLEESRKLWRSAVTGSIVDPVSEEARRRWLDPL